MLWKCFELLKKYEGREKVKPELVMKYTHTCDIFCFTFMRCMFILLIVNKNEWGRGKKHRHVSATWPALQMELMPAIPHSIREFSHQCHLKSIFLKERKSIFSYLHDIILPDMFSVFIMLLNIWRMYHDKMMSIIFTRTFVFQSHWRK